MPCPPSVAVDYTAERPLCTACGVFAVLMVAIRLPGGSPIYAPTSLCGVCRDNYIYVRRP